MSGRVIVTGVGVVSALGASKELFRDALLEGRSGMAPVTAFDVSGCRTRFAAPVSGFDPTAWIPPMKLRRMDDTARYAIVASQQAFADAAYTIAHDGDDDAGIIMGTYTAGGQATSEYLTALHKGGPMGAPALLFNSTVANAPASLAGLEFKLRGPNVTLSQKEASGLAAIVSAVDALRLARSRVIAAGGVDAIFDIFFRVHDRFGVMSPADPATARGPFDRNRRGFVLGEGGFALVIERADAAVGRTADPYGEILGVHAESAAVGINEWAPASAPLARTMRGALADARLAPDDVDVVYASANATRLDAVEAEALAEVFGSRPQVAAIKGAIGECGASGAAAVAAALLCGAAGEVPPIVGLSEPIAAAAALNLVRQRAPIPGPVTMINSVGSGGALFSVLLRITGRSGSSGR
jgi:3-oxoacyl-[acyl-carrier-protein] synthase II